MEELIEAQALDKFCKQVLQSLNMGISMNFDDSQDIGVMERKEKDGQRRAFLPTVLQPLSLRLSHHPVTASHP